MSAIVKPQKVINALSFVAFLLLILTTSVATAQTCTANAGGNATVCGSSTTLHGSVVDDIGTFFSEWKFISGPVTPVIVSPNDYNTEVTGMTVSGNYIYQLNQPCSLGVVASSQVTITAHPKPASFTAGPDKTGICATIGTTQLNGVIPAGFTGSWSAVNIYYYEYYGTTITTNSALSNNTIANPVFSLIDKTDHEIDPAYYAILTIVSDDGVCTYKDTAVVRFCPNPALELIDQEECIDNASSQFFDFDSGPGFSSGIPEAAGSAANGTTITLNVTSQPDGGNITFDRIEDRRIYVTGASIPGDYVFTVTVSNCCGTKTSNSMTYTVLGMNTHQVNLQPAGHGAPEQLAIYAFSGTAGEVHCGIAGTSTPETFYFSINPADNPLTTITTVRSEGILPPGASTPVVTITGAGMVDRIVTVNPGTSGWKVGTYAFNIQVGSGSCFNSQDYYIHISDNNRPPLHVDDMMVCYPGTGNVSAVITLPDVYQGVVNSSYFQDFEGYYNFQVISKPAGSATPVFPASNLRRITQSNVTISNLNKPGNYVIRIIPFSGNGVGPFLEQEYACSGIPGPLQYDFTIHLDEIINSNAGSDQTGVCATSVVILGNATGAGTGLWTVAAAPDGASPNITAPANRSTTATNLTMIGEYKFAWTITTPVGQCKSSDTVSFTVTCVLPVSLSRFTAVAKNGSTQLGWTTVSESNNKGFGIERSADGQTWSTISYVNSKAANGNSTEQLDYTFIDKAPLNGNNFYRLKQTDMDGRYEYSAAKQVSFENGSTIIIYPNPTKDYVTINGLSGGESVKVYNASGHVVKELKLKPAQSSATIQLDVLSEGLYHIHIISTNGTIVSKKIVKLK